MCSCMFVLGCLQCTFVCIRNVLYVFCSTFTRDTTETKKRRKKLAEGDEKMEKELAMYDAKRQSKVNAVAVAVLLRNACILQAKHKLSIEHYAFYSHASAAYCLTIISTGIG